MMVRLWLTATLCTQLWIAAEAAAVDEARPTPNKVARKTLLRPEEQGEDLSNLSTPAAVRRLSQSKDVIERHKLAKAIGDRTIAGNMKLSQEEEELVRQEVTNILNQAKSPDAKKRSEARQQIERLWYAAVPTLIANVTTNDPTVAELAVKSLILMRDEAIVNALIREARSTSDEGRKQLLMFALSKMKEQRKSSIPGRVCLDERESEALYLRLIVPALEDLKRGVAETK